MHMPEVVNSELFLHLTHLRTESVDVSVLALLSLERIVLKQEFFEFMRCICFPFSQLRISPFPVSPSFHLLSFSLAITHG